VVGRTRGRLHGLTDNEYFWEPAPGCWSVRQTADGMWAADGPLGPETGPLTTIAWRLWHLTGCYASPRARVWLRVACEPVDDARPAATAEAALQQLEAATRWWTTLLDALASEDLTAQLGPVAGPFEDSTRLAFVLHMLDEQVHHGAEIGLLRDLYLARG
jgi:hypothetical protein